MSAPEHINPTTPQELLNSSVKIDRLVAPRELVSLAARNDEPERKHDYLADPDGCLTRLQKLLARFKTRLSTASTTITPVATMLLHWARDIEQYFFVPSVTTRGEIRITTPKRTRVEGASKTVLPNDVWFSRR